MRPDLSICIANHRTPELTLACLRSIVQYSDGLDVELLLANNTPDDQEQLADRAVNTSRMHQVGVYVYRSKGTIEQHIMDTNIDKREINKQILDLRRNGFRADMAAKLKEAA